jgi:hypothetical protein
MTTIDIINRINTAIRAGDAMDLDTLADQVSGLVISHAERTAWLALIGTALEGLEP